MDITQGIFTINGSYPATDSQAWSQIACPSCRNPQMLIVARQEPSVLIKGASGVGNREIEFGDVTNRWLLCVACNTGAVEHDGQLSPPAMEFPTPDGTPKAETKVWQEVRECLSIHAYNAVVMLCRKLLLNLVFTHERSQNAQATPRRMTFGEAVQYLLDNGVITTAYERLATEIKDIGNRANHELPDITGGEARKIALFTHYLFVTVYEIPKKARISPDFDGPAG